jgi:hypothetical protein
MLSAACKGTCIHSEQLTADQRYETCTVNLSKTKCEGRRGSYEFFAENAEKGQLRCISAGYTKSDVQGSTDDAVKRGDIVTFSK